MSMLEKWMSDIPAQFLGQRRLTALITVISEQLDEVLQMLDDLEYKTTLEGSEGKQLDRIGEIVNINRQEALQLLHATSVENISDDVYRAVLYFKILKNNTDCTYYDIMKGLHYLWDFDKAVLTYEENPFDETWVNGYDTLFVDSLPASGDSGKTYFLQDTGQLFDTYQYISGAWEQTGSSLLTTQQEQDMRNHTVGRNAPATILLGIEDIPSDAIDPIYVEPMVIRAGGVNLRFKSSYRDLIECEPWERFTNLCIGWETLHEWNGTYDWDGQIQFHSDNGAFDAYNRFQGKYKWDGEIYWGAMTEGLEVIDTDAVFLQQARRKTLQLRARGGEDNWKIMYMVWGDGTADNGLPYTPDYTQTELKHEVLRKQISYYYSDDEDTVTYVGYINYDELVNQDISEIALADSDGMLICIKTFEKKRHGSDRTMLFKIDDTILMS